MCSPRIARPTPPHLLRNPFRKKSLLQSLLVPLFQGYSHSHNSCCQFFKLDRDPSGTQLHLAHSPVYPALTAGQWGLLWPSLIPSSPCLSQQGSALIWSSSSPWDQGRSLVLPSAHCPPGSTSFPVPLASLTPLTFWGCDHRLLGVCA